MGARKSERRQETEQPGEKWTRGDEFEGSHGGGDGDQADAVRAARLLSHGTTSLQMPEMARMYIRTFLLDRQHSREEGRRRGGNGSI